MRQLISIKRGKHSEKPIAVKEAITAMFSIQNKIELFARNPGQQKGWTVWGLEAQN